MLSDKEIICPNNLLNVAHKKKGAVVGIVNAGKPLPMLSVMDAVHENLIIPILIGDKNDIQKCADDLLVTSTDFLLSSQANHRPRVSKKCLLRQFVLGR